MLVRQVKKSLLKIDWGVVVLVVICTLIALPALKISWSLLDDGVTIIAAKKISSSLTQINASAFDVLFERASGRFRPFYWIFNWLVYLFSGTNPHYFFFIHSLLLISTAVVIYFIARRLSVNKYASLISSLFFSATSLNIENWYRLGPVEPLLGLLISLLLLLILSVFEKRIDAKSHKYYLVPIFLVTLLIFLSKETAFALIPFFIVIIIIQAIFYYVQDVNQHSFLSRLREAINKNMNKFIDKSLIAQKKDNLEFFTKLLPSVLLIGAIVLPIVLGLRKEGVYSGSYVLSRGLLVQNLKTYLQAIKGSLNPFFEIVIVFFVLRNFYAFLSKKKFINKIFIWELLLIALFLILLAVQLPWGYAINRYLLPSLVPFSIFWGLEMGLVIEYMSMRKKLLGALLLTGYLVVFVYNNVFLFINYSRSTISATSRTERILKYVSQIAPYGARVLIDAKESDATIEPVIEAGYHLHNFYERPDLKVEYLDLHGKDYSFDKVIVISAFVSNEWRNYGKDLEKISWLQQRYSENIENSIYLPASPKEIISYIRNMDLTSLQNAGVKKIHGSESVAIYTNF